MNILVLGAYGLLGSYLCPFLKKKGHQVFKQGSSINSELSFSAYSSPSDLVEAVKKNKPDIIINLIALTNVDKCESDPELAFLINVKTVENILASINNSNIHLIQISTDQVYSGQGIHKEEFATPINIYGITKYCSELVASKTKSTILRTNYFSRSLVPDRKSFSDWLVESFSNKDKIMLFEDIQFNAVHVSFLLKIIEISINEKHIGIFNVGCKSFMSKSKFGLFLGKLLNLDTNHAIVGKSSDSKLLASRPKDMRMSIQKLEKIYKIQIPTMEETTLMLSKDYL